MIKDIAWNVFKSTGDINTFLELKEIKNIENNMTDIQKVDINGNCKNKRDNNIRK